MKGLGTYRLAVLMLGAVLNSGCAMLGNDIPPEQLAKLATIEGAAGYPLHSIDGRTTLFTSSLNVEPGEHVVELTIACQSNQCVYQTYRFNTQAGLLYRLMPSRKILVLDRNDQYQRKVDELLLLGGQGNVYGSKEERTRFARAVVQQETDARNALIERRRQNIPWMKKVGARICQAQGYILYTGFVESFTDEKLQIRVAEARMRDNPQWAPGDFQPHIVWDSPLNWDLCE
ncbi:hypothetical protein [Sideroxydans sp.]